MHEWESTYNKNITTPEIYIFSSIQIKILVGLKVKLILKLIHIEMQKI